MTAFIAVADRHGFAPAARHLGLAPSAVTRLVAGLEAQLGVRLLARTPRSVGLTDAGSRYLDRARRIIAELTEAESAAQSERARPTGKLVVTAPAVFGRLHVAPLMSAFLARHEAVTGQLLLSDRWANLVEDGIDLAVRIGHLPESGLIARRIGATRRVLVASPGYLARHGAPAVPQDVAAHPVIRFDGSGPQGAWRFQQEGTTVSVPVAPRLATNSADAAIWAAEQDGGLTMVLGYQVADALRTGRLRLLLPQHEMPPLPIQLVYPEQRLLPAKLRGFIDLAVASTDWQFVESLGCEPPPRPTEPCA